MDGGSGELAGGGSYVTLKSGGDDYSIIIETRDATAPQEMRFTIGGGLSPKPLCVWRSDAREQFVRQPDIRGRNGAVTILLEPGSIYSLSTTRGQQKGGFTDIPASKPYPFPYRETFDAYPPPADHGYLPRYTADIAGSFQLAARPDGAGTCLRQVVPVPTISWAPDWQPYTILGDAAWGDYEAGADVWLNPGDRAGIMGRINHVGTGYGFIPKGYYLELADDGACGLIAIRGKRNPKALVGDAEQQRLIKAGTFDAEGGELVLGATRLTGIAAGRWHKLSLRMQGTTITGLVDGKPVLTAENALYAKGMAGLLAGQDPGRISTPWFHDIVVAGLDAPLPEPTAAPAAWMPIYGT
ncbi:hypothetical protein [Niveispirillum sp. KHB5.9]|uniref:hypothetical protein n=1 Tax=Niveispirillum sp. KHB5.9 TaxID=3400269 RepID=UPI003A885786